MNGSSPSPTYRTFNPGAQLRDSVEVIWDQECSPVPNAEPTTIVPTGRVECASVFYVDGFVDVLWCYLFVVAGSHTKKPGIAPGSSCILTVRGIRVRLLLQRHLQTDSRTQDHVQLLRD